MTGTSGTVLVVGATGVVGQAATQWFSGHEDWRVLALSRSGRSSLAGVQPLAADLTDARSLRGLGEALADVTHVVYAALHDDADVVEGWTGARAVGVNVEMFANLMAVLNGRTPKLRHVALLQGTKAYGLLHHGQFPVPAKEDQPRALTLSFYFAQEDELRARSALGGWDYTILRPQLVCGTTVGSSMNAIPIIGVYGAVCSALGLPLSFPGGPPSICEAVDAGLLARAIAWAGRSPQAAGEVFNITNGDCFVWENVWPAVADALGMAVGRPRPTALAEVMPAHARTWDQIVARHELAPLSFTELVPSWGYADFLFRRGMPQHASLVSTIKIRRAGFHDCLDTEEMLVRLITEMQDGRRLPPRVHG